MDRRCKPTPPSSPDIRRFVAHLAAELGLARASVDAYRRDLQACERFVLERGKTLLTADGADLVAFIQAQSAAGRRTSTVTRRHATLRVFLRYLLEMEIVPAADVAARLNQIEAPKPERPLPKILSRAQVNALIAAPDPASFLFDRDVAILELLYAGGLRASELCELKPGNYSTETGAVRVFGKGAKERLVPVGKAARDAIARYLAECRPRLLEGRRPCDRLFLSRSGRPIDRVGLWGLVERYGRKSGLLKSISPHVLRHCFASHMVAGGADLRVVQELLGHSDIGTTEIYTHVDSARLKLVHEKYHPRG